MKCIDCSLYKFDGKEFRCPATPWHEASDGMFQEVTGETCMHRAGYASLVHNELRDLELRLDSARKHIRIASEALKSCDGDSDLAKRLRFYISQYQGTLANGLMRLEYLNRQLCKLTVEGPHEPKNRAGQQHKA